jgi:hypothetical protein
MSRDDIVEERTIAEPPDGDEWRWGCGRTEAACRCMEDDDAELSRDDIVEERRRRERTIAEPPDGDEWCWGCGRTEAACRCMEDDDAEYFAVGG